jgi:hypothetical protein
MEERSAILSPDATLDSHTRTIHLMDVARRARLCVCIRHMAHHDGYSAAWMRLLAFLAIG